MGEIEKLVAQEEYSQALAAIDEILREDEYNIDMLTLKAHLYYKLARYIEAIDIYSSLVNLITNDAEYYAARGLAYNAIKEHQYSLADFTTAIKLEPDNGYRYSSRAFIKDSFGDQLGALEDYNKAIELDPGDAVALNNRGLIEEKLGRLQLSQESFARADELAGKNNQTHNPLVQPAKKYVPRNKQVDFRYYKNLLKSLFISASERKKFFKFLFKR